MGGPSTEREVSLKSGEAVVRGLEAAGYDVSEVVVDGESFDLPSGVEAVFIALHGMFGEDGSVQELLDRQGMPYTGSGAESSRCSFDKITTKEMLVASRIPTADYAMVSHGTPCPLAFPVVVKPARQGSTIGISKVDSEASWEDAVTGAFAYGDRVLAETFIPGRELTVGLLDGQVLPVVEVVAREGWYDYQAKYETQETAYVVPAEISGALGEQCQALALRSFEALGARGMARVDFRMRDRDNTLFVLELNSIPGFTECSLLPKAAAAAGIDFAALCDRIMRTATCDSSVRIKDGAEIS